MAAAAAVPTTTVIATSDHRVPFIDPSCQKMICSREAVSPTNMSRASAAPANAFTAIPVSSRVTASVRPCERAAA